jgi:hypothetical protein
LDAKELPPAQKRHHHPHSGDTQVHKRRPPIKNQFAIVSAREIAERVFRCDRGCHRGVGQPSTIGINKKVHTCSSHNHLLRLVRLVCESNGNRIETHLGIGFPCRLSHQDLVLLYTVARLHIYRLATKILRIYIFPEIIIPDDAQLNSCIISYIDGRRHWKVAKLR